MKKVKIMINILLKKFNKTKINFKQENHLIISQNSKNHNKSKIQTM